MPDLEKHKFLVPQDLRVHEIMHIIRRRMGKTFKPEQALFLFVRRGDKMAVAPSVKTIGQIDENSRDSDGFVYFEYTSENTFG